MRALPPVLRSARAWKPGLICAHGRMVSWDLRRVARAAVGVKAAVAAVSVMSLSESRRERVMG